MITATLAVVATASAFTLRFTDSNGNELDALREGESFCLAVHDPDKGGCGITSFRADVTVFDFKTGAYIDLENQTFRKFNIGSGLLFWVDDAGRKRTVQVGDRKSYADVTEMEHSLGSRRFPRRGPGRSAASCISSANARGAMRCVIGFGLRRINRS